MKQPALIALFFLSVLVTSCGSFEIPEDKQMYIGTWIAPGIFLQITPDGKLNYEKVEGSNSTSLNVPITAFEGDNFKAGALGFETTFEVSQPPTVDDNGELFMVVDGKRLVQY